MLQKKSLADESAIIFEAAFYMVSLLVLLRDIVVVILPIAVIEQKS